MTLRQSVFPAAFALAGCLSPESEPPPAIEDVTDITYQTSVEGGPCKVEHLNYEVHGRATLDESMPKSRSSAAAPLLVTVSESSSVVHCDDDTMRVSTPGAELESSVFSGRDHQFALSVPGVIIGGHRPSIRVEALLDENDNGVCDNGEPVATLELTDDELGNLALELSRDDGCPTRL